MAALAAGGGSKGRAGIGERRYAAAFDADDPESLLTILGKDPTLEVEQRTDELLIRPQAKVIN